MKGLTKFPQGSVKEVLALSYPIFLGLSSTCLMAFCDRYFLSRYSLEAFEGACIGGYLALLFQAFCIQIISANQVFISRAFGEKKERLIGPYTWQMIWFSFLGSLLIIPIGLLLSYFYFSSTVIESLGRQYFIIMLFGNCLFSLTAAFTTFQSGIGKTSMLTVAAVISNICNFVLNYLFIFGVEGVIPPLGVKGAALGTVIAQGVSAFILFIPFIQHKKRSAYQTDQWQFSTSLFLKLIRLGIPRGISRCLTLFYWVLAVKVIAPLEGDYTLVLAYGATLLFSLSLIAESLGKGLLSLSSFFLGKNETLFVWKSLRSVILILFTIFLFLGIPLAMFPEAIIQTIIKPPLTSESLRVLKLGSIWLWIYFFLEGLTYFAAVLMTAMKKTVFDMKYGLYARGFLLFVPYYLCFSVFECNADKIWMANWVSALAVIFIYFGKAILEEKRKIHRLNRYIVN